MNYILGGCQIEVTGLENAGSFKLISKVIFTKLILEIRKMKGMKGFGNNDKNKTGNINQHHLPDSGSVLSVLWKQNLYWQYEHHCTAWLLKP